MRAARRRGRARRALPAAAAQRAPTQRSPRARRLTPRRPRRSRGTTRWAGALARCFSRFTRCLVVSLRGAGRRTPGTGLPGGRQPLPHRVEALLVAHPHRPLPSLPFPAAAAAAARGRGANGRLPPAAAAAVRARPLPHGTAGLSPGPLRRLPPAGAPGLRPAPGLPGRLRRLRPGAADGAAAGQLRDAVCAAGAAAAAVWGAARLPLAPRAPRLAARRRLAAGHRPRHGIYTQSTMQRTRSPPPAARAPAAVAKYDRTAAAAGQIDAILYRKAF